MDRERYNLPKEKNGKMNNKRLKTFLNGVVYENPVLVLTLGICPALAQTGTVISALSMGVAASAVLVISGVVISLLRGVISQNIRIPAFIIIIAGFVSVVQMLMHAYLPSVYEMMGVYLSLIVVNCIILGRAEGFARKNGVIDSFFDGLGMGTGFLLALFFISVVREVFGLGSFFGIPIPHLRDYCIPILSEAPGGFLVFGFLISIVEAIGIKKSGKSNCSHCPSCADCNGGR